MPLARIQPPSSCREKVCAKYNEVYFDLDAGSHSAEHRPKNGDDNYGRRDEILHQFPVAACRGGRLVAGQDARALEEPALYWMRNPKFVCMGLLNQSHRHPSRRRCIIYSLGSADEISFEVGLHESPEMRAGQCEVHVFDPGRLPDAASAARYGFQTHRLAVGTVDVGQTRTLESIMACLGHAYVDVMKIDIEGREEQILPRFAARGGLKRIGQLLIEFHNMGFGSALRLLQQNGFEIAYGRREARFAAGTEVSLFRRTGEHPPPHRGGEGGSGEGRNGSHVCAWQSPRDMAQAWPLAPGASWGVCGATLWMRRDSVPCRDAHQGAWHAQAMGISSLDACAARCRRFSCCRFVSFSPLANDCSWYSTCPDGFVQPKEDWLRFAYQSMPVHL